MLGGNNFIELKDGKGKAGRPPVYVEAYVPLVGASGTIGVVEVYVDMTEGAGQIQSSFLLVGALVGGVVLLLGSALALQVWRRGAERRRMDERVHYLARHDVLSGALNRASFEDALQQTVWRAEQGGPGFSVLCIDLNGFKDINDAHGHAAGDDVLRQVADRLRNICRQGDLVARLGGDEFAVLQTAVGDAEDMARFGQRVVDALREPYDVVGRTVNCGGSVGAARFGTDATDVNELMHRADVAMYRAKTSGGGFSFYDASLDASLEARRQLARDLKEALAQGALSLDYQPIFGHGDQALLGYEALMRWRHPTRGAIPPSEFIPLAETCGHIETMGAWALQQACAEAARWPEPLTVSVNLSAAQFRGQRPLIDVVASALADSGLAPNRLVLEITESLLMSNAEQVLQTLNALSALGVQVAMDDFGTGYSSLAYLWRFPFDKIKIDRAFTQGLEQGGKVALIVRSIVTLAHSMGLRVNAEGVETHEQRTKLEALGCDELQGFLLGRPVAPQTLDHARRAVHTPRVPAPPELKSIHTQPAEL